MQPPVKIIDFSRQWVGVPRSSRGAYVQQQIAVWNLGRASTHQACNCSTVTDCFPKLSTPHCHPMRPNRHLGVHDGEPERLRADDLLGAALRLVLRVQRLVLGAPAVRQPRRLARTEQASTRRSPPPSAIGAPCKPSDDCPDSCEQIARLRHAAHGTLLRRLHVAN